MELTSTEYKVAELVTQGLGEKQIASEMFVSPKTIHNHTYNIRKRNGLKNNVDIAREFILSLDDPKQYFAALFFLIIQFSIIFNTPDVELRRAPRPTKTVSRTMSRTGRKNQDVA